jgi:hypothetical protein
LLRSVCAADLSVVQLVGARTPAADSIALFVCIASGDQSFGKPYVWPPCWNALSRRG